MLSQNQLKYLRSLAVKKYRHQHHQFIVEGDKMVSELLLQTEISVDFIFALERWAEANARFLRPFSEKLNLVSEDELSRISTLTTPNQVLAVAGLPSIPCQPELSTTELCFYLDGIQDPGNMGSILRVADWFGFPAVFCSPDCADVYSSKVVQASMGAILRVQSWEIGLAELLSAAPGIPVAGAVLEGENLFEVALPQSGLIVIGNEGRGISKSTDQLLTHRLSIPKHQAGKAESLNAAIASGILAAVFRNRKA